MGTWSTGPSLCNGSVYSINAETGNELRRRSRKFTGKERDNETGLDHFGARYYGAETGRFTTVDPVYTWRDNLVDPQRWNRYAYVRNSPLRYTDPDGRLIDTLLDIGFVAYDIFDIGRNIYKGEDITGSQLAALGGDVVGVLLPFATGVGMAVKAGSKADDVLDARRAVDNIIESRDATKLDDAAPTAAKPGSAGGPGAGRRFSEKTKEAARAENQNCVFCEQPTTRESGPTHPNVDHAVSKSRGGNNTLEHAQNTCRDCNLRKGARTQEEFVNQRQ